MNYFRRNRSYCWSFGLLFVLFCMVALPAPAQAAYWYVTPEGAGDGTSWKTASADLAAVLGEAADGDEIWVAAGTYRPTEDSSDRSASFVLESGVLLYGGFNGTETSRDQRDFTANVTVLTGDIDHNDSADEYGIVTSADCIIGDNSYHVVRTGTVDSSSSVMLDGFTVTAGNANSRYGGGIYSEDASLTFANCTFTGNSSTLRGGGGYSEDSSLIFTNCTFTGNSSTLGGGGFYSEDSSLIFTNCTFSENSASQGGGMCNYTTDSTVNASVTVDKCMFSRNSVGGNGAGMANFNCDLSVRNSTFSENSGFGYGGGMYNLGSVDEVTNCTFSGNSSCSGAGIYIMQGNKATVTNCTFSGNNARYGDDNTDLDYYGKGGGMALRTVRSDCKPVITNCTFTGNTAQISGNALFSDHCIPWLTNCIVWDYIEGQSTMEFSIVSVVGSILKPVLNNCVVLGTRDTEQINCFNVDPLLGELADNGGSTRTCALGAGSCAVDAGLSSFDMEDDNPDRGNVVPSADQRGISRLQGTGVDIGAYEAAWHTVTVSADMGCGTVSAEPYGAIVGSADFAVFSTPTFVITPVESMDLTGLFLDGDSIDIAGLSVVSPDGYAYAFAPLSVDHTLEAVFAVRNLTITGAVSGDHGSVSVTPASLDWGDDSTVHVVADEHYHIDTITVDGASHDFGTESKDYSFILEDVSADHSIEAVFAIDAHTLAVQTGGTGTGTVTVDPAGGIYDYGTEVTLTATEDESSRFTGWSGNLTGTTNPATLTVDGDRSVTADFAIRTFGITAMAGTGGSVSPTSATVDWGGSSTVTITPSQNYAVADISVDGTSVGAGSSYTFSNVRGSHILRASFVGSVEEPDFTAGGDVLDAIRDGAVSVDLPGEMTAGGLDLVESADIDSYRLGEVHSGDISNVLASADVEGDFLCGVSFDVTASHDADSDLLPVDLELVVSEESLSTECLEAIAEREAEAGLAGAFLSRVSVLKVLSGDAYDLSEVALDSECDPRDFISVSRDEGNFLVGVGLLIADGPAGEVAAVQAVPVSGDCRFLVFDGVADGHYRDPLVAVENGNSEGDSGGCNAFAVSGLGLLLVPLLFLLKK